MTCAALAPVGVTAIGAAVRRAKAPAKLGRIRIDDDSLECAGISKGEVVLVELGATPKNGDLCAAFLATGHLRIRRYFREPNGDIMLARFPGGKVIQVFAPAAIIVFGPVVDLVKGGGR